VRPAAHRAAVGLLQERFGVSERRACRVVGVCRSSMRYRPTPRADEPVLRRRLRELALERRRFGYRRLHVLLAREGVAVNHKRVERLYRDEGLTVRRWARRRVATAERTPLLLPTAPNEQWSLDFVSDALSWGRRIRLLAVVDTVTREALAIEVDTSLPGERVVRVLERTAAERGVPHAIVLDNGPELTGRALDQRAYGRGVQLRFIAPDKPVQNVHAESFIGRLRDECLNELSGGRTPSAVTLCVRTRGGGHRGRGSRGSDPAAAGTPAAASRDRARGAGGRRCSTVRTPPAPPAGGAR
jgi:putative transposase